MDTTVKKEHAITAYQAEMLAFFQKRVGDRTEAEDLYQDLCERVLRRGTLEDVDDPLAFLFAIARNLLRDRWRRRISGAKDKHIQVDDVEIVAPVASPEVRLIDRQRLNMLRIAIQSLTEKRRRAFVLHRFSSMTYGQIAQDMNISVSMVQKHISMALLDLRSALRDLGDEYDEGG